MLRDEPTATAGLAAAGAGASEKPGASTFGGGTAPEGEGALGLPGRCAGARAVGARGALSGASSDLAATAGIIGKGVDTTTVERIAEISLTTIAPILVADDGIRRAHKLHIETKRDIEKIIAQMPSRYFQKHNEICASGCPLSTGCSIWRTTRVCRIAQAF